MKSERQVAVFDFGGVLFNTSATEMYREMFKKDGRSEDELKHFLSDIFTKKARSAANLGNMADVTRPLAAAHPEWAEYIRAFEADRDFIRQVTGVVEGMEQTLKDAAAKGIEIYGLTNWAGDTFETLAPAFPGIMRHFNAVVVSGKAGIKKPDPAIFRLAQETFGNPEPSRVWYFDDKPVNVAAAQKSAGWNGATFENAGTVRRALGL